MLYQPADAGYGNPTPRRGGDPTARLGDVDPGPGSAATLALLLATLRRRKKLLLCCALGVPLLVGLALLRVEPRYTASGSVLYEPQTYTDNELQSILRRETVTEQVISSQAELIRSTGAAEKLVDRFHLTDRPDYNWTLRPRSWLGGLRDAVRSGAALLHLAPASAAPDADDIRRSIVEAVQDAIAVTPLHQSHVIEVSFTSPDPALAAAGVNALLDAYIADQLKSKFDAVRNANQWLETQAQQLQKTVSQDEARIAAYKARNGFTPGMVAGLSAEDVSHVGDELVKARTELATAEARLDAARGRSGLGAQAAVAPSVQPLRAMAEQLNGQYRAMQQSFGSNMPQVVRLREQVAQANRAVDAEIGRVVAAADADARAARAKVAALQQSLQSVQAQSGTQAQAQVPLDAMQREADASRVLLQSVLAGIQRLSQQTAIEHADARIVSTAVPPNAPSFPKIPLLMGAALIFGICLGLLLTYLLELADGTVRASEDIRRRLGLPCLALVPQIIDGGDRPSGLAAITGASRGKTRDVGIDDYIVRKPHSHFAEQIRSVRAAVWFASAEASTIAITSARPNEGKTTTAIALGRSAALNGERVIVVDCDIRQPSLGEGPGLSDYLRGEVRLADIIHRDPLTTLSFVPVGTPADGAGTPFMSDGMSKVLAELKKSYDLVILDSPPVLAMTDARVIARLADATLICVRWRDTPHAVAGRSLAMLNDAQAQVTGAVLTRIDPRAMAQSGFADAEMYDPRYAGYYRD